MGMLGRCGRGRKWLLRPMLYGRRSGLLQRIEVLRVKAGGVKLWKIFQVIISLELFWA